MIKCIICFITFILILETHPMHISTFERKNDSKLLSSLNLPLNYMSFYKLYLVIINEDKLKW